MQTVLKFFAGILSLGASRKVFIALVAGGIVVLNARFGWNLPTESLAAIVLTAVSLIIAIAMEDAAAKKAHADKLATLAIALIEKLKEQPDVAGTAVGPAAGGAESDGDIVADSDAG